MNNIQGIKKRIVALLDDHKLVQIPHIDSWPTSFDALNESQAETIAKELNLDMKISMENLRDKYFIFKKEQKMEDWTAKNGVSNTSDLFLEIVEAVEKLIKGSAFDLINGRVSTVAALIVASLAHTHNFIPLNHGVEAIDSITTGTYLEYNGIRIGSQVRCFSSEPMKVKAIKEDKAGIWFLCESKDHEGNSWTAWFHESYTTAYK